MGKAAEIMASLTSGDVSRHSSRHYGTVTAIDAAHDKVTVLLDGATEPTVCDSRDVKVYDNDRVEVEIRDHKATIKANAKHQVTDDGVALDALDQAAIARGAAEDAVGDAAAAQQAATAAAVSASNAETSAGNAATAATNAQTSAGSAATAASEAQSSAGNAASSASAAQTSAGQAQSSAATAASAAQQASADASAAATAAQAAQTDAATAKRAADRSLVQLSIVEDVAGTLHWIAEHGTYTATSDTTVQDGKVYFELVSGDYVPIAQPTGNPQQQGWYVLDITDSQTEYIMAHLAVTSQGLWVLPSGIGSETTPDTGETQADSDARQGDGYKVLLSNSGMTVYDNYGDAVATYGETTTFASDRDWYVGSSPDGGNPSAFIFFDASENAIQIGGANVTIGGLTPGQLAGSQIWTATADPTTPNYTFAISNLTGPSGVSPRVGDLVVRSYYRYTISSVSTTTVLTGNRTSIRGGTGAAGSSVTVSSVEYAYQLSTSGTTVPTGTWGSTPVAPTATQYAWTRTTTTYSDNTTAVTYTVGGKGGADGSPGTSVTISSKSVKYQASTSGTTTPTGTWLDSVPTVAQGSYLWTRTVVTYSTGDSTTAYSVARMGSDGQTGAAGPEAVVSISVTAADFSAGTATLSASLRVIGTVTTPTSYKWTKGTATTSLGTSQTLSITDLNASYHCTVTWSGGTQVGFIDLTATSAVKTYAAATFATQSTVSTMQTEIETNAGQIALRATKTEAYQLSQPNLSPFFESTPYRTATSYDGGYWQPTSDNWLMAGVTYLSEGWAHVTVGNSKKLEVAIPRIESIGLSDKATLLIEWRGITVSGSPNLYARNYGQCQFNQNSYNCQWTTSSATSGEKRINMTSNASVPSSSAWYAAINLGMSNGASVSFDGDLRISIYAGHDYAGPWKPYSGNQLYASQAELKVANDAISTKVEKNGVISSINQSAESVTINANRVNIEGATIFTSGRLSSTSLNNAYDAKGAAATVQTNLNNLQIGGRNLFALSNAVQGYIRSSSPYGEIVLTPTSPQHITSDFIPVSQGDIFTTQLWNPNLINNTANSNRGVCWYDSSKAYLSTQTGTGDAAGARPTGVAHWSFTFNPAPANAAYARFGFIIGPSTNVIDPDIKIKVERGSKPTDWSPAPEDQTAYVDEIQDAIISRGEQLVINGSGFMGDNTNFSSWSFDGAVTNNSAGSFTRSTIESGVLFTDDMFPVDPSKEYIAEFDVKAGAGGAKMYAMLTYFDVDKLSMTVQSVSYIDGSTTTLARELKNGDTKVYLTSVAGFNKTTTANHQRALIFWNYTNSYGYTYPPETYSRKYYYDLWADSSSFDTTNNTITLKAAWNHGTFPAGTSVSQNTSGAGYPYFWYVTNKTLFPTAWTHISGTYKGIKPSGSPEGKYIWPGTAYCKIGWIWNYGASSTDVQDQIWVTNVSVKENRMMATQRVYYRSATAASVAAPTTWVTANGNVWSQWTTKVPRLTQNADGSGTKYPYLYTCEQHRMGDGSIVCTAVLLDENTTVIDGGSIITNSITANKIQANSLTLGYINQNDAETAAALLNSNVQVGGRNLLLKTSQGWSDWVTPTANANNQSLLEWRTSDASMLANGATLTFSCDVEFSGVTASSSGTFRARCQGAAVGSTNTWSIGPCAQTYDLSTAPADGVYHYEKTVTLTADYTDRDYYLCKPRMDYWASGKWRMRRLKLEVGNKATDWSPAPEDQTAYVDAVQVGGRNYIFDSAGVNASCLGSADGSRKEYQTVNVGQSYMNIPHGTQVTISFDLYLVVKTANPRLQVYNTNNKCPKSISTNPNGSGSGPNVIIDFVAAVGTTIDQRISATCYVNDRQSPTLDYNVLEFYTNYGSNNFYSISNLKMEIGNKPTDWTPAPEDQQAYVAATAESITATIDTEVGTLTSSISGVSNSLATLGTKVDNLLTKATELEKKTQWVKWDDTEGMIFGENGTAFNTRLKAENMTFNYGNQTMMTLSATGGVDAPKVRTQRLELGSDWAITISGDMFAIDYIGS